MWAEQAHPAKGQRLIQRASDLRQRRVRPLYRPAQLSLPTFGLLLAGASEATYLAGLLGSDELSPYVPNDTLNSARAIGATTERAYFCSLLDVGDE